MDKEEEFTKSVWYAKLKKLTKELLAQVKGAESSNEGQTSRPQSKEVSQRNAPEEQPNSERADRKELEATLSFSGMRESWDGGKDSRRRA